MSKFTRKLTSSVAPTVNTPGVFTVNERTQNSTALVITSIVVCDSGYNELDDTALGTTGGYLKIKGTGFLSTATVYLNGVLITPTVTSSLELRIIVPTLTVGTYSLIVFNTAAVGAIWAPGLVISGVPVWSTTTIATANLAVNTQLVATGDATLVYTLASGSLPPGVTLSSSGLLSGTISPVPTVNTVYNFTVDVKDAQNQNLAQAITFSLSVEYFIAKSLRFRSSASAYLNRAFGTPTTQTKYTISTWLKRGTFSTYSIFSAGSLSAGDYSSFQFNTDTSLAFWLNNGGANGEIVTSQLFRDPAAWYHIVVAVDTTQVTASSRIKMYVNGTQITSFSAATYPALNSTSSFNRSATIHAIGALYAGTYNQFFDGEMAEVNFVDGQALAPTSFGAYSTYNQWLPKAYTGTYGTNGFYLPFSKGTTASYAASFNGSTQYLATPSNQAQIQPSTSNFTIEFWFYLTTAPNDYINVFSYGPDGDVLRLFLYTPYSLILWTGSTPLITANNSFTINTWNHLAIVRSGTTVTMYVNGVSVGNNTGNSTNYTGSLTIGFETGQPYYPGRLSNFRIVKGTAVYTANFTPPTEPLTAITNTSLLTLQNATIVDNSTNAFTITNNGTMVTSVQSPFLKTTVLTSDSSGNANNWTPNNINVSTPGSTYDLLTDVPTLTSATAANYAVINAINPKGGSTVSNGNLTEYITGITGGRGSNIAMTSGKFYCEVLIVSSNSPAGGGYTVADVGITSPSATSYILESSPSAVCYYSYNGTKYVSGTPSAYGTAWSAIGTYTIGMALDVDAGTLQFYLNNVGQGNITLPTKPSDGWIFIADWESSGGSAVYNWNFGQQPWTYTPPANFLALNTYNI